MSDPTGWEKLAGGTMATVARRGDLVRRSTGSWTPAVHALLTHLEAVGFDRAPRVRGVDQDGRELLTYLPGDVPRPGRWRGDDDGLAAAGRLLRRYHDATATFAFDTVTGWDPFFRQPTSTAPEVVCHNDFAFYNCVFVDGRPWGMIDFDAAAPGSRLWDLGGTALGFIPVGEGAAADLAQQLRLLCGAYDGPEPAAVLGAMERRLRHVCAAVRAVEGTKAPQAANASRAKVFYDRQLRALVADRPAVERALTTWSAR